MATTKKQKRKRMVSETLSETVLVEAPVLHPVITPESVTVDISVPAGQCVVGVLDDNGNEVGEFLSSTRSWDRVYSKQPERFKKKA